MINKPTYKTKQLTQMCDTKEVLINFGKKFSEYRIEAQINKQQVLVRTGLTRPTLIRFETGHGISLLSFIRLLRVINKLEFLNALIIANPIEKCKNIIYQNDKELLISLGFYIYFERTMQGMSQRELAQKIGISIPTISSVESGKNGVSLLAYLKCLKGIGKTEILSKF